MTVPPERQAGAQGLLGGVQTVVGGLTALIAGWVYDHHGRTLAYTLCAVAMLVLVAVAAWRAGPSWYRRPQAVGREPVVSGSTLG